MDLALAAKKNVKIWLMPGATLKKASTTVTHMFTALEGDLVDGLTFWLDGTVDLNRAAFAVGNTVSLLFAVRTNGLRVIGDGLIKDGIEEGLKLYKCQRVRVGLGLRFFNIRNNGIQLNAPSADSYAGGGSRADQDVDDVYVDGVKFEDIFDELGPGWPGEGQAIGMGDGPSKTCKNVRIRNVESRNCIRGVWGEFNATPGENISIADSPVWFNKFHGHGFVGVLGGSIIGCPMFNVGSQVPNPPDTPSEVAGIDVGGTSIEVTGNPMYESRGTPFFEYGIRYSGTSVGLNVHDNPMFGIKTKRHFVQTGWANITKSRIQDIEPPQCRVQLAANWTTLVTAVWTDVPWDGEVFDDPNDPMHSTVTNKERVNLLWPGRYRVSSPIEFPDNSDATIRGIRILTDDGVTPRVRGQTIITAVNGDVTSIPCEAEFEVTAVNSWVRIQLYQNTGSNMTIAAPTTTQDVNYCLVRRVAGQPMV